MIKTRRKGKAGVPLGNSAILNDVILRFTCSLHAVLSRYLKISQHRLVLRPSVLMTWFHAVHTYI